MTLGLADTNDAESLLDYASTSNRRRLLLPVKFPTIKRV